MSEKRAWLVLEDGTVFAGEAFGAIGETFGEAVFDTGMGAYQEMLTDPGHHRHIVVATAPHTGNTGWNEEDSENPASRVWVAGYVVRDPSPRPSNWRSQRSLDEVLIEQGVVGMKGVDTRALTTHLRRHGSTKAAITSSDTTPDDLLAKLMSQPDRSDAVLDVTTPTPYTVAAIGPEHGTVVAIDLGLTVGLTRQLARRGLTVRVLPASASLADIDAAAASACFGVCLAGGPGDPASQSAMVDLAKGLLAGDAPILGVGLGAQVVARALGLDTHRLAASHHGVNQPVQRLSDGKIFITAHNHCYTFEAPEYGDALTDVGRVRLTHVAVNDGTPEGFELIQNSTVRALGVQFNPAFGPRDTEPLLGDFATMVQAVANA